MLRQTVMLLSCVSVAFAALALGPPDPKPKKFEGVEGCYMKDIDAVIPFGQSASSKTSCMEYRCGTDLVTYVTCGAVMAVAPCYTVEDKSKPYPDCCKKIKCE